MPSTRSLMVLRVPPVPGPPGRHWPLRWPLCHRLVRHAGAAVGEELDQLGAAHDARARDEVVLVELALLEARGADVHRAAGLREVGHQLAEGGEALFVDAIGIALLGEADSLHPPGHGRSLA